MSNPTFAIPALVSAEVFTARLAALEDRLWGPSALAGAKAIPGGAGTSGVPGARRGASEQKGALAGVMGRPPRIEKLAEQVRALSDLYNAERPGNQGGVVADDTPGAADHLPAKVFYFLASDAPKPALVLRELAERWGGIRPWPAGRTLRVVDAGCGVGATAAGVLLSLDAKQVPAVEIVGLDSDAAALRIWRPVVQQAAAVAGVRVQARPMPHDLRQPADDAALGPWDLVIAQAVLNELSLDDSARADWLGNWARRGLTIAIEPALHATTRPLHRARDLLLAPGSAGVQVLAPCPHQLGCPMLRNQRDWCHEVRVTSPTPRVAAVQARTRRRDERTKFSFLVLAPGQGVRLPPPAGLATSLRGRLVSDALNSKGKMRRWLCTDQGALIMLRLLDRQRTAINELLATAERGTRVRIDGATALPRIGEETTVDRE